MPQPTAGDVHVNVALTNISIAYLQDASNFVADKVFPVVPVENQSNFYWIYDQNDFLRDEAKPRSPGAQSAGGGFKLSTATYSAVVEAWHEDVADQIRSNADTILRLDTAATQLTTQKLMIRRERRFVNGYFQTGIWGTDQTPTNKWDTATGDPVSDIDIAKGVVAAATGFIPNTVVINYQVFNALRNNSRVRDQFKYTSAESINEAMMANLFQVERVLVSKASAATNIEGGTAAYGFMAGKNCLVSYVAPQPSIMTPTAGYVFAWNGYIGMTGAGIRIKRFRMEELASDRIEGEMAYDMKMVAPAMGYFLSAVIS